MANISKVLAREILNSKAIPTVEAMVVLDDGSTGVASCPTGTSVSNYEAKEVRDNDPNRYDGLGTQKAVSNIINIIGPKLNGMDALKQHDVDKALMSIDGSPDKSHLGVNAVLPVSMAVAKAAAKHLGFPLFMYLRTYTSIQNAGYSIPTPAFNVINGGKHAGNNLDFQEFIIVPATSMSFNDALNMAVTIYHALKNTLKDKGSSTLIGDEGGFGPVLSANRDAFIMLNEAISSTRYRVNYDVFFGIDASANNFHRDGRYTIKDKEVGMSANDLVTVYEGLNEEFNLLFLEDPFGEDDWEGWQNLNNITSKNTLVIGDDLIATNLIRLQEAISKSALGGVIIKPNQIGTVTEAIAVAEVARNAGIKLVASHRSGETNDDFIADLSVAIGADYAKFGAPARGERIAKYNRLLEIESQIHQR